jgi:hypothetical protein
LAGGGDAQVGGLVPVFPRRRRHRSAWRLKTTETEMFFRFISFLLGNGGGDKGLGVDPNG